MPTCFVIMGYGEKTDLATGRKLNLDMSYHNVIKPAIEDAGFTCIRADEVLHSGLIDVPMYQLLFDAELVVADLSTSNLNAMFELGVRHALKPWSTIVLAEQQFTSPFDVNHIVIRKYLHLGPDIGHTETLRMRQELTGLAQHVLANKAIDSPVYTFLAGLEPPQQTKFEGESKQTDTVAAAVNSFAVLFELALKAKEKENWEAAKQILHQIAADQAKPGTDGVKRSVQPRIVQELALATYKAGEKVAKTAGPAASLQAYAQAIELLRDLDPDGTTDPETLGLWSAIHKRRGEMAGRSLEQKLDDINTAIWAAERGFLIRQDYYNGGNLAYLFDLRAAMTLGEERIADRVMAQRVRRRVLLITEKLLSAMPVSTDPQSAALRDERYWIRATHLEALCGLKDAKADGLLPDVLISAPVPWMADTTQSQIQKLRKLQL